MPPLDTIMKKCCDCPQSGLICECPPACHQAKTEEKDGDLKCPPYCNLPGYAHHSTPDSWEDEFDVICSNLRASDIGNIKNIFKHFIAAKKKEWEETARKNN